MITIRSYQAKDADVVEQICLQAANHLMMKNPAFCNAITEVFCRWYLEYAPEDCFVAEDDHGSVKGYILCARDFFQWEQSFRQQVMELSQNPVTAMMGQGTIEAMRPYAADYPAHLHIDLLPECQRQGIGGKLIKTLIGHLRRQRTKGLMLNVANNNKNAVKFYEKQGFILLDQNEQESAFGMKLEEESK